MPIIPSRIKASSHPYSIPRWWVVATSAPPPVFGKVDGVVGVVVAVGSSVGVTLGAVGVVGTTVGV